MIIDGIKLALEVKQELKDRIERLNRVNKQITLVVILVGDDKASKIYIRNKQKACDELHIKSKVITLPENVALEKLLAQINNLNKDKSVDGILVQSPLPSHIDQDRVYNLIAPEKDVDCFNPQNVGKMFLGGGYFSPCTPSGIVHMINKSGYDLEGKRCVVVGRSNIVGKPTALLLLQNNATVTIANSYTRDLKEILKRADLVVSAVGKAGLITADMIKEGAFIVDVGMNRDKEGKLCGDVNFLEVEPKAGHITPVPGGVGPMTIAMLMRNTVLAAERNFKKSS